MSFSPTGDEDMVSDVTVISIGQENGENGIEREQHICPNLRPTENAFQHNDGILGQTRMALANQCEHKLFPDELNKDKNITQSNLTKKGMVAKLISFFSFNKSDSTSKLLIKSNENGKQEKENESSSSVDVESAVSPATNYISTGVTVNSRQAEESTVTVTKQFQIDINISMKSAVTTTIISENPVSKSNSSDTNTCINVQHSSASCLTDTAVTNELQHDIVTHYSNMPPAEIHLCSETNKEKTNYSSSKLSHCQNISERDLISDTKNLISSENHSVIVSRETQSNNVSIKGDSAVSNLLLSSKITESNVHVNTEFPLNKNSEMEGFTGKKETVYDLESNTTKKTDSLNNMLQGDNSEGDVTPEKASSRQHIKVIDNTTNSIHNQKTRNDKYVDLQISEKAEETSKSNTLTRSENITNNQSCSTSVSAKPSDKSLIIESGSLTQTATATVQSRSAAETDNSHTQEPISDTLFSSHRLLQNQIRVLHPSNYNAGKTFRDKLDGSESCSIDDVETRSQKALQLLLHETKKECDDIASDHGTNRATEILRKKEIIKSTGDQATELSGVMELSKFRLEYTEEKKPYLQAGSVNFQDSKTSLKAGNQSSEFSLSCQNDTPKLPETNVGIFDFNKKSLCIPNPKPPIAHAISETKLPNPNRNGDDIEWNEGSQFKSHHSNYSSTTLHDIQSKNSNNTEQQYSKPCDIIQFKFDKSNKKGDIEDKKSSTIVELKCNVPESSKVNGLQKNSNIKTKKPNILSKISANTDLLMPKTTPRGGSKAPNLLVSINQTKKSTEDMISKPETSTKNSPQTEEKNDDLEFTIEPNIEFSESLDSSSENEDIRVEEFSVDDTEDDTWSLATFAMPTKLEMDQKEEDIPMNYYKRKRLKKKSKGYFKQFYRNPKDESQNIDNLEIKKPLDLPFLKSQRNNATSSKENNTECGFDENGKDRKLNVDNYREQNKVCETSQKMNDTVNAPPKVEFSLNPPADRIIPNILCYDKNAHGHTNVGIKPDETKNLPLLLPNQDKLKASTKRIEEKNCNATRHLHVSSDKENNLERANDSNSVSLESEMSQVITLCDDGKKTILPDIKLKENSDVSIMSSPKKDSQPHTEKSLKTTKMSSLLAKTESMSLPKVSEGIKKVFTFKESRKVSKSQGQEQISESKDAKTKSSTSKDEKGKKKVKKAKTTKFSRNLSFIKPKEKVVKENYDKFGEKEEKLRDEKPNKFRFDQLPRIRKSKPKEEHQGSKKVTKSSSNQIIKSVNLISKEEFKLPSVGDNLRPEVHDDTEAPETDKDLDNGNSEQETPLANSNLTKQEKKPKQKRKKKKKKKKVQQMKELCSEIDSDSDLEIDPNVYFTSRAGNSSRPNSSHDIPQLISKIKLTASCADIKSLCGDLD